MDASEHVVVTGHFRGTPNVGGAMDVLWRRSSVPARCARRHAIPCRASVGSHATEPLNSSSRTIPGALCGWSRIVALAA
jgi:hypothetical protein